MRAFSCSGTPADCVRAGSLFLMPVRPAALLSGINYGYNVASDIQYSATAGAAFEASFQGIPGIALSEEACARHEVTDAYLRDILRLALSFPHTPGEIVNVNFPGCPLGQCRGILEGRTVSRGMVFRDRYREVGRSGDGALSIMVEGIYNEDAEEGTDFRAVIDHYISVGTVRNIS